MFSFNSITAFRLYRWTITMIPNDTNKTILDNTTLIETFVQFLPEKARPLNVG